MAVDVERGLVFDLQFPTFTDSTAWVMIFTPTACSRSTPEPAR
jgi:hypothetical protein